MRAEFFGNGFEIMLDEFSLSDEEFYRFASQSDTKVEREADGTIILMEPVNPNYSNLNLEINTDLNVWNRETKLGKAFDATAGFTLPDKSVRSPDAAWIENARLEILKGSKGNAFPYICPDFVMELRSPSDSLPQLQRKMAQYMANGCRLSWLLDPVDRKAWIYRPGQEPQCLEGFTQKLSGEGVMPGFVLDLGALELPE